MSGVGKIKIIMGAICYHVYRHTLDSWQQDTVSHDHRQERSHLHECTGWAYGAYFCMGRSGQLWEGGSHFQPRDAVEFIQGLYAEPLDQDL